MSWLISLVIAGALFTNGNVPITQVQNVQNNQSYIVQDETERTAQTYPFSQNGRIEISNVNGSITIETWDNPQIKFESVKIADSRERLADLEVKIDASQDSFRVEADYGRNRGKDAYNWKNGKLVANFRLTVPRTAVLDEIETVNGSVTITNAANLTKASTVNGSVKAMNLRGNAELSTVNGTVEAEFDQLQAGSMISLSTVNGRANLIIPSDANATVRAESVNGEITNDFGLPVRKGKYVGRNLYGKIGSGDIKIKLESVNGGLAVKRKSDGKNQNPAIDLLPAKSADDDDSEFDFNFDDDFSASMRESRREIEKSQREIEKARRETEKSVRVSKIDAEKLAKINVEIAEAMRIDIEKIKPEIAKISEEALKEAVKAIELAEINININSATRRANEIKARVADERFPWRSPFLEEKSGSYQVKGTPSVKIETVNCKVSVRGWDKPEVKYSMSKVASNIAQQSVEFTTTQKDSGNIELKAINQNESGRRGVSNTASTMIYLEVFVPKKSNLKIVTNDEVRLEGVSGDIDLQGGDQGINIRDTSGKLTLKTEDGIVRIIGFSGELDTRMADGEMFLEGDFQKINANVGDGTIYLTVSEQTNANITANTDSVEGDGITLVPETSVNEKSRWRIGKGGKDYNFNLEDGNLIIRNRSDLNASL